MPPKKTPPPVAASVPAADTGGAAPAPSVAATAAAAAASVAALKNAATGAPTEKPEVNGSGSDESSKRKRPEEEGEDELAEDAAASKKLKFEMTPGIIGFIKSLYKQLGQQYDPATLDPASESFLSTIDGYELLEDLKEKSQVAKASAKEAYEAAAKLKGASSAAIAMFQECKKKVDHEIIKYFVTILRDPEVIAAMKPLPASPTQNDISTRIDVFQHLGRLSTAGQRGFLKKNKIQFDMEHLTRLEASLIIEPIIEARRAAAAALAAPPAAEV